MLHNIYLNAIKEVNITINLEIKNLQSSGNGTQLIGFQPFAT